MYHFQTSTVFRFNFLLIAAAVVPAIFLMVRVYRSDRLEKESPALMRRLAAAGILSSLLAMVEERIFEGILSLFGDESSVAYNVILYFLIVGVAEESSKYIFLKHRTWRNPEFNSQYDGVVYAVFVSLGFALWENISYVLSYGFTTALVRAATAIPGHACFGVFMGVFYGAARRYENAGQPSNAKTLRALALAIPVLLHGAYDFIATMDELYDSWFFVPFVAVLFIVSYLMVGKAAKKDRFIVQN